MQACCDSTLASWITSPVGPCRPPSTEVARPRGYQLRVYNYPCGVVEAVATFLPAAARPSDGGRPAEMSQAERAERDMDNERRAVARAKAAVRRLCLAGGMDRLLTLTYRANVTDQERAWGDFARFVRRVRGHYPKWRYVAVMELQKRGAVHFHMAVRGFQDVGFLRSTWRSLVGEGNIDVTPPRGPHSPAARASSCARYITKYMLKEAVGGAYHRYRSSHIEIPMEVRRLESLNALQAGNECLAVVTADGRMLGGGTWAGVIFAAEYGLTWAIGWVP